MEKIKDFEKYSITRDGRVWSWHRNLFLSPGLAGKGYPMVVLFRDGKPYNRLIHRLMAQTYIPNPENKREVNHKDGNKQNNFLNNLEWATPHENRLHGYKIGLHGSGENHHQAKLKQSQVDYIREQYATGKYTFARIANVFGVSTSLIQKIVNRIKWK
jgi:hypothetical protein